MTDRFVIDCDQKPPCGHNWVVSKQKPAGSWEWNPDKLSLFVPARKKIEGGIYLEDLNKAVEELKGYKILNANVLNFMLKRKYLVPETLKGPYILFWDTTYGFGDLKCIRGMHWAGSDWVEDYLLLSRKIWLKDDYRIALAQLADVDASQN